MFDQLAQITGVAVATFGEAAFPSYATSAPVLNQAPPRLDTFQTHGKALSSKIRVEWSPCLKAVNLLIRKPDIIKTVTVADEFGEIRSPDMDLLLKVIEIARAWPDSTAPDLLSRIYATAYGSQLTQLLSKEQITPEPGIAREFEDIITRLLEQYQKRKQQSSLLETLRVHHAALTSSKPDDY